MLRFQVLISAQSFENYATDQGCIDADNPFWKKKGMQEFIFEVGEVDLMDYTGILEFCRWVCQELSGGSFRYEYRSHEVKFSKPQDVTKYYEDWGQLEEANGLRQQ